LRFASKQDRLSADDKDDPRIPDGGTPGWQTYNLRAGLKLVNFGDLQFAVENIFDYNYRKHGSGVNGPGRNFILSLELKR
jgi:hemoglobin/transferrin/lactoferrin receptor protein